MGRMQAAVSGKASDSETQARLAELVNAFLEHAAEQCESEMPGMPWPNVPPRRRSRRSEIGELCLLRRIVAEFGFQPDSSDRPLPRNRSFTHAGELGDLLDREPSIESEPDNGRSVRTEPLEQP